MVLTQNGKKFYGMIGVFLLSELIMYAVLRYMGLISIKMCLEAFIISLILLCICLIFIKFDKRLMAVVFYFLWLISQLYMVTQLILNRRDVSNLWPFSTKYMVGIFIWLSIWIAIYLLFGKIKLTILSGGIVMFFLGMANYYVTLFRGTGLSFQDIYALNTALKVANGYHFSIDKTMMGSILFLIIIIFSTHHICKVIKEPKVSGKVRFGGFLVCAMLLGSLWTTDILAQVFGIQAVYYRNGNGILLNIIAQGREQLQAMPPQGYSYDQVEKIYSQYISDSPNAEETPNIVVVMNESFADLAVLGDFKTDQEVLPVYHNLTDHVIKGWAYSSVFGGGTANSEYEFLMSDSTLGYGIYPYAQIQEGMDLGALSSQLSSINDGRSYYTVAMHPFYANGWRRSVVYGAMEFDRFDSLDDFSNLETCRGTDKYATDASQYEQVKKTIEEKEEPVFIFNVTIQNHGGYASDSIDKGKLEEIRVQEPGVPDDVENYLSLAHESDRALGELIEYLRNLDEPTILLMFGDHQPQLSGSFYEEVSGMSLQDLMRDPSMKLYMTPFLIYSNYGLQEKKLDGISVNYLSALMLKEAGLPLSAYQKYLLDLYESYPIITSHGTIDRNGVYYDIDSLPEEVMEYQAVIYSHWKDKEHKSNPFFYLMGENR